MTGAGAPGAPGILKCLQFNPSFKIFMVDANSNAVGRWLHAAFDVIPPANDPGFVDAVISLCKKRKIDVVLPLVTKELIPLSQHKMDFEAAGIKLLISPFESIEIANNKSRLYQFLEWRGIEVPAYRVIENLDQFITAAEELGYPARPFCFKPSVSNGSRGFRIVDASINEHEQLLLQKPYQLYFPYEHLLTVLSAKPFPELLVMEYLPGEEYSVDCLAKNGEMVIAVPRVRKQMINGISVEGEFVEDQDIIHYCRQIIGQLKLHGNIGIQVKKSSEQKNLILEINPRVQGTISAGLGAGINLPGLAVKQELGMPITADELKVKWGTRFSRYWNEVFY
ncbi:MAG: hypothetical protein C4308_11680 [Chitinophagaceae bacterium]